MDYRSDEAKYINQMFMRGELATQDIGQGNYGFKHRTRPVLYCKTTQNRLIRIDGEGKNHTYNLLSADRRRFQPVTADVFVKGEKISTKGPFGMDDLVPAQSNYEFARDVIAPRVLLVGVTVFVGHVIGVGLRHFLHLPSTASSVVGNTAAGAAGASASHAGAHTGAAHAEHAHFGESDAHAQNHHPAGEHAARWQAVPPLSSVDGSGNDVLHNPSADLGQATGSADHSHPAKDHLSDMSWESDRFDEWNDDRYVRDTIDAINSERYYRANQSAGRTGDVSLLHEAAVVTASVGVVTGLYYVGTKSVESSVQFNSAQKPSSSDRR